MAVNISLSNAGLEALLRFFGDLNLQVTEVPTALVAGSIVGACSFFGGLIGGRIGLLVGGSIGYQINNFLLPRIRNVNNMLRELGIDQLLHLFDLLVSGIQNTVSAVLGQIVNPNLYLTDLLERFGNNYDVRMNMIQTLIEFLSRIHGRTFHQVTPQ